MAPSCQPTALVSFSKKAWGFVEKARCPRYYFDVRRERQAYRKSESAYSAAVPLIRGLDFILQEIQREGLSAHYHRLDRRARMTREFAKQAGLELYSQSPSASVTALTMPAEERQRRMRRMRASVEANNVYRWAGKLLEALLRIDVPDQTPETSVLATAEVA